MVVYCNTIHISWGEIRKRVENILRRELEVVSLAANRAIIWCQNEEEISSLLSNPLQFSKRQKSCENREMESICPLV